MHWIIPVVSFFAGLVIGFTWGWVWGIRDMLDRVRQQIDRHRQAEAGSLANSPTKSNP